MLVKIDIDGTTHYYDQSVLDSERKFRAQQEWEMWSSSRRYIRPKLFKDYVKTLKQRPP